MDVVMPPLLRSAQLKPDITVRNADSDNEDEDEEDERSVSALVKPDRASRSGRERQPGCVAGLSSQQTVQCKLRLQVVDANLHSDVVEVPVKLLEHAALLLRLLKRTLVCLELENISS
jgi:hypothetical protein